VGHIIGLAVIALALGTAVFGWLRYSAAKSEFVTGALAGNLDKANSALKSAQTELYVTLAIAIVLALIGGAVLWFKRTKYHSDKRSA
jgi:hypothetical protein